MKGVEPPTNFLGTCRQSGRIFGVAFLKSGRPRGPGKAFQNVGGEAPHILEGLPGPGPARPQKRSPEKPDKTVFRYPDFERFCQRRLLTPALHPLLVGRLARSTQRRSD